MAGSTEAFLNAGGLRHARFVWMFGAILGTLLACGIGANFLLDPLMMFHRPWVGPYYASNERYRVPGFARSLDYDTAIVGASTAMAIMPGEVRAILGGAPVIQVIGGATISEESLAVNVTAQQGKLKRVIWLVDPVVFSFGDRRADAQLPEYLYVGGASNLLRYLLDRATFTMSLTLARHLLDGSRSDEFVSSLDALYRLPAPSEYSNAAVKEAFYSEKALAELQRRERAVYLAFDESKVAKTFDRHVFETIKMHPRVKFEIVLTPSSVAFYQYISRHFPKRFEQSLFVRKLAYERIMGLPNARLFDMQTDTAITEDYRNFNDMLHFSPGVGNRILEAIRDGKAVSDVSEPAARAHLIDSVARVPLP
ncbi:MAG: hypothetical protein Q8M03_06320 [Legionella sp.]|nr:hypothetical protein [Legionella sp.]